jgi:hypothetical protein
MAQIGTNCQQMLEITLAQTPHSLFELHDRGFEAGRFCRSQEAEREARHDRWTDMARQSREWRPTEFRIGPGESRLP